MDVRVRIALALRLKLKLWEDLRWYFQVSDSVLFDCFLKIQDYVIEEERI
jgi:hypothetical protein